MRTTNCSSSAHRPIGANAALSCFLDPQGNQVKWTTIEAITRTLAIDLWYLFPAGLGVHRQIGKDGSVHATHEASLDELVGTQEWRNTFIEEHDEEDLFGPKKGFAKVATTKSITLFMIQRMRQIFKGGVLDEWLPLGSRGIHMYSLLFAWPNPSEKGETCWQARQGRLGEQAAWPGQVTSNGPTPRGTQFRVAP